ncbi:MAG: glycosyltransferase family 2 protein, partial [Acetobacteraceae bacterium]
LLTGRNPGKLEVGRPPRVVILLATYNGAAFLSAQLRSFLAQTHSDWVLFWRDDGSADDTVAILEAFAAGEDRCVRVREPAGRLGATANFLALLRTVHPTLGEGDVVAFADQDDVWLPCKLARGVAALAAAEPAVAALYCARQVLVDAGLRRIGESPRLRRAPAFPASLTQNIAAGCTVMLNRRAVALVADSAPPAATFHDWWCYLVVTASGGACLYDDAEVILYRQHGGNIVGVPPSMPRRALAAMRRGPAGFMDLLRAHVEALAARPEVLAGEARENVIRLREALGAGMGHRLVVLLTMRLRRATVLETALFWLWFVNG